MATLPKAAAQRLSGRLPLKQLSTDVPMPALPLHASYRQDPKSDDAWQVLAQIIDYLASQPKAVAAVHGKASPRSKPFS